MCKVGYLGVRWDERMDIVKYLYLDTVYNTMCKVGYLGVRWERRDISDKFHCTRIEYNDKLVDNGFNLNRERKNIFRVNQR